MTFCRNSVLCVTIFLVTFPHYGTLFLYGLFDSFSSSLFLSVCVCLSVSFCLCLSSDADFLLWLPSCDLLSFSLNFPMSHSLWGSDVIIFNVFYLFVCYQDCLFYRMCQCICLTASFLPDYITHRAPALYKNKFARTLCLSMLLGILLVHISPKSEYETTLKKYIAL